MVLLLLAFTRQRSPISLLTGLDVE